MNLGINSLGIYGLQS